MHGQLRPQYYAVSNTTTSEKTKCFVITGTHWQLVDALDLKF